MATVQTFGVDQTYVQSFCPQITVSSTAPLTSSRLTQIVEAHAAKICGLLEAAGVTPADVATDTTSVLYKNCARLVFTCSRPEIIAAAHGQLASQPEVQAYYDLCREEIEGWTKKPTVLGSDVSDTASDPIVRTSTQAKSLNTTSDEYVRGRRRYDRRRNRTSGSDDVNRW